MQSAVKEVLTLGWFYTLKRIIIREGYWDASSWTFVLPSSQDGIYICGLGNRADLTRLGDLHLLTCISELVSGILPSRPSFPRLCAPLQCFRNASCSFLGCRGVTPAKCSSSFLGPECLPSCLCLQGRSIKLKKAADNTLVWCIVFRIEWEGIWMLHITNIRNQ